VDNNIAKKDFVALAVHKLKTPISSIKLSLEMLIEGDFGNITEEQKRILERTYQRNEVLICLVNDLLNLAKIEENNSHTLSEVNFSDLIKSIVDYDQESIERKALNIRVENRGAKLKKIMIDAEKMFLAIQNVFNNAVKYSNVGGEIIISYELIGKILEVRIQDFGIGIPEAEKNKLFTEFFRGENAKEMQIMGSGLGLYITKGIIEGHDGKVWFESEENKGTTFFITLPIG